MTKVNRCKVKVLSRAEKKRLEEAREAGKSEGLSIAKRDMWNDLREREERLKLRETEHSLRSREIGARVLQSMAKLAEAAAQFVGEFRIQ